jgi:hypothetical protein
MALDVLPGRLFFGITAAMFAADFVWQRFCLQLVAGYIAIRQAQKQRQAAAIARGGWSTSMAM